MSHSPTDVDNALYLREQTLELERATAAELALGNLERALPTDDGAVLHFTRLGRDDVLLHYAAVKSGGRWFLTGRNFTTAHPAGADPLHFAAYLLKLGITAAIEIERMHV